MDFAYSGEPERLLEQPERAWQAGLLGRELFLFFEGMYAPVIKTQRFKKLMRDWGWWITGKRAAGPNCATPPPATTSSATEMRATKIIAFPAKQRLSLHEPVPTTKSASNGAVGPDVAPLARR